MTKRHASHDDDAQARADEEREAAERIDDANGVLGSALAGRETATSIIRELVDALERGALTDRTPLMREAHEKARAYLFELDAPIRAARQADRDYEAAQKAERHRAAREEYLAKQEADARARQVALRADQAAGITPRDVPFDPAHVLHADADTAALSAVKASHEAGDVFADASDEAHAPTKRSGKR